MMKSSRHAGRHVRHGRRRQKKAWWKTRAFTFSMVSVAVLFLLFVCFVVFTDVTPLHLHSRERPAPKRMDSRYGLQGIDVSHHQGEIDWAQVAASGQVAYVYLKATEGSDHVDTCYEANLRGCRTYGLPVGSYHFFTASSSAAAQARHFIRHAERSRQDLLPMVDVEWSGTHGMPKDRLQDSLAVYTYYIKQHYGRYPIIYADRIYYSTRLEPRFNKYPLFIAHYTDVQPIVERAHRHLLWQRDVHGKIDGIAGDVDIDVLAEGASLDDLRLP